jgi:pimeloyl-ACP methyl ester carboxylesterase
MKWLILRGLTRDQRHWGAFPKTMSAALGTEVVGIDAPGFGTEYHRQSPKTMSGITDDIRSRFTGFRGEDEWSLLGISLGGMVTLDWCARYPEDFARAVIINSSASDSASLFDRFNPSAAFGLISSAVRSPAAIERTALLASSNRPHEELEPIAKQWAQWREQTPPSKASVLGQMVAATRFKLPATVKVPALVLNSRNDRLVSYKNSEAIAKRIGATLRVNETAGHDLATDDPDWICEQVAEWVGSPAH